MKLLLLLLFGLSMADVNMLFFRNNCTEEIEIVQTEKFRSPESLVVVPAGAKRMYGYTQGAFNFQAGFNGLTSVDVIFMNDRNRYAIMITEGFDKSVTVEPMVGRKLECAKDYCEQGVWNILDFEDKVRETHPYQRMLITFCAPPLEQ